MVAVRRYQLAVVVALVTTLSVALLQSCKHEFTEPAIAESGYPENVERIIVTKCATAGCHDDQSKEAAAGLSLQTWERMFEGSRSGATVIPYRPDFSTLIYYTNAYDDFGLLHLEPRMPYNADSLSYDEMQVLYDWVLSGAPDKNGLVKFSEPERKKFYVANQMCDVVTVFDAQTKLASRYVNVGSSPNGIEQARAVCVAPNNEYWAACVGMGQYLQLFSTADNTLVNEIDITAGGWNNITFSPNSAYAFVADKTNGRIAIVDLTTNTTEIVGGLFLPGGLAVNPSGTALYATGEQGNYIYKIPITNPSSFTQVSMNGLPASSDSSLNIHQIVFSPDGSKYFISCEYSSEVRAVNAANDSLVAVIPVGTLPQTLAVSTMLPYLFVSCTEDITTFPGKRGSVYVIDYNSHQVVTTIQPGHQPYGLAVDDENNRVYVSNRNVKPGGPIPHHAAACAGKNGNITAVDMSTLTIIEDFKAEVSVDPYVMSITH